MKLNVERYNYRHQFEDCMPALLSRLESMLLQGSYILSDEVQSFERAFAAFLGISHAVGVNTGTDALAIALRVLEVGQGSEVITVANTFHATVLAIVNSGARPVLVDADDKTFLMDQRQIASALNSSTRVLLPVHLYGKPVPMDYLLELSTKHGIHIVEDACQAHGAKWLDRHSGTQGHIGCFSFHPSKNLGAAGDGGMIATGSDLLAKKIMRVRSLGQDGQNNHVVVGCNSRLDALQAAVLLCKLPKLNAWNRRRREVAAMYIERLQDLPLAFQETSSDEEHVYHLFQVRTDSRDRLLQHLKDNQIDAVVRYPVPIHLQPAFSSLGWKKGQFPVAEKLSQELLALPIRPDMSVSEVDYVCDSIRSFFSRGELRARKAAV
jgi:dTDP-4-amino-4,6-dideoxygalactose transaminase